MLPKPLLSLRFSWHWPKYAKGQTAVDAMSRRLFMYPLRQNDVLSKYDGCPARNPDKNKNFWAWPLECALRRAGLHVRILSYLWANAVVWQTRKDELISVEHRAVLDWGTSENSQSSMEQQNFFQHIAHWFSQYPTNKHISLVFLIAQSFQFREKKVKKTYRSIAITDMVSVEQ